MKIILSILQALLSLALFTSAVSIASSDIEYIIIAALGVIYVTVDFGITITQHHLTENNLSNKGYLFAILNNIQNMENSRIYERRLCQIEKEFEENKKSMLIHIISSLIIVIGCALIIIDVVNV